jgi:hypothetical protein
MLSTEKISQAFDAIATVADQLKNETDVTKIKEGLGVIRSIAKHQSDIRNAPKGSCSAHEKTA